MYMKKGYIEKEKKGKNLSAPAVSNPHWEAPILKVRARYWRGTRLQHAEIRVFIQPTSSQSLTAKVLQVGFLNLMKLL